MKEIINISPHIISTETDEIYGILRQTANSDTIFICLPANTGTRIGPQRIFVEISNALLSRNISSFCVDLPPLGDSYSHYNYVKSDGVFFDILTEKYSKYLNDIIKYFGAKANFKRIGLISISSGCFPCYMYALHNNINDIILLSPDYIVDSTHNFNKKNFRRYYYKLMQLNTWKKLINFQLNYNSILKNIYQKKVSKRKSIINNNTHENFFNVLSIFGDNDEKKDKLINYWINQFHKYYIKDYSIQVISKSDHSFFGWQFKRDVEDYIVKWLEDMYKDAVD